MTEALVSVDACVSRDAFRVNAGMKFATGVHFKLRFILYVFMYIIVHS